MVNVRALTITVALTAILYGVISWVDANLDKFYIFTPEQLHKLALSGIEKHGNDTRAVVGDILANLQQTSAAPHLNLDEEWIFNNAGGAMGGMYIIHASEFALKKKTLRPRTYL